MSRTNRGPLRQVGTALLVACCLAMGACSSGSGRLPNAPEKALLATYVAGSEHSIGTGFIVAARGPGGDYVPVFLTASHLIPSARGKPLVAALRLITREGQPIVLPAVLSLARRGETFATHPVLDVVAFQLDWPEFLPADAILPVLDEAMIAADADVRAGEPVMFAGFPEGAGGPSGAFALLRTGTVASIEQSLLGLPVFVVNAAASPGDSGAPVFRAQGRRHRIVGMVVECLTDGDAHPKPLALAVDAAAIRETIDLLLDRSAAPPAPGPRGGNRLSATIRR